MQIVENRALQLKLRTPSRVTDAIKKSRAVSDTEVLVHWGLREVKALQDMGIDAPSPIVGKYDWPGRFKPMEHQKKTAGFMTLHKRCFCFNEQGTGKTASAIWAADYLMKLGLVRRALIICPVSIMDSAWRGDLFSFAMHRTADTAYGTPKKRKAAISSGAEFVVTNYEGVDIAKKEIAEGGFDLIIVDEASHYKNSRTKRWKALNNLLTPEMRVWLMTGTPAAQSPVDAHGLALLVRPGAVPRRMDEFRDRVMRKETKFRWVPKDNAVDTVHEVLQPAIRFEKSQCMDLPEMLYTRRLVELTPQQKKYYKALKKDLRMDAADTTVTASNAAIAMNKLLQVSAGALYDDDGGALEFDISSRYNVLREVIDESSRKVLVFMPFRSIIGILLEKLQADGVETDVIHGGVSVGDRTEIFRLFQSGENPRVLLIQPQAAAHGVTLTAANTVVWWSPTSSLETYAQANARIHRKGQSEKCTVVQLSGSYMEKRLYDMLEARVNIHTQVLDLYRAALD